MHERPKQVPTPGERLSGADLENAEMIVNFREELIRSMMEWFDDYEGKPIPSNDVYDFLRNRDQQWAELAYRAAKLPPDAWRQVLAQKR